MPMMNLSDAQRQEFFEQGYLRVPNVVPKETVNAALRAINYRLGEGIDPTQLTKFRSQSYCPELQKESVITDLYNATPAKVLAESY